VSAFRRACRLERDKLGLRFQLARALAAAGEPAEAKGVLDNLLARLPQSALRGDAQRLRARISQRDGQGPP
jgi:hypothetical protein